MRHGTVARFDRSTIQSFQHNCRSNFPQFGRKDRKNPRSPTGKDRFGEPKLNAQIL